MLTTSLSQMILKEEDVKLQATFDPLLTLRDKGNH